MAADTEHAELVDKRILDQAEVAYAALRRAAADLDTTWTGLRNPALPWHQTRLLHADHQHTLESTAEAFDEALGTAARHYQGRPEVAVSALRSREGVCEPVTVTAVDGSRVQLATPAEHYVVHYDPRFSTVPDTAEPLFAARRLVAEQTRYLRDTVGPR